MDKATIKAQLEAVQTAFWTAVSKANKAHTDARRQEWAKKREALRPEYQRLLEEYKGVCQSNAGSGQ